MTSRAELRKLNKNLEKLQGLLKLSEKLPDKGERIKQKIEDTEKMIKLEKEKSQIRYRHSSLPSNSQIIPASNDYAAQLSVSLGEESQQQQQSPEKNIIFIDIASDNEEEENANDTCVTTNGEGDEKEENDPDDVLNNNDNITTNTQYESQEEQEVQEDDEFPLITLD